MVNSLDALDIIMLLVLLLGAWNGYRTGFIRQVTRLFGGIIAYAVSYWLRPYVAPVIEKWHILPNIPQGFATEIFGNLSGAVAFLLIFVVTYLILRYAAGLLETLFSLPVLSFINRLAGLAAGILLTLLFLYIAVLVLHYIHNPALQAQLRHSQFAAWLSGKSLEEAHSITIDFHT
ncbi:membrane protein required for colicin V production [Alicyclobacillus tolerans]|uniref:Membrane protein required for colicin V production n=1 Tax=Alicyclobacillus tolerans TaxID=90970 RepID=A0A1M6KCY0_9BACL|nr:membrane protein required for colicin V production [Alicyclobacillus montanus]